MSFKGFVDTDVNELRKNLKKRSELAAEFKEQLDNQQGITNYQKEVAIKQSKPIIEALEKQRDSQNKSTIGAQSELEEKRVLNTTPNTIIEYFRTLRPDLFRNNKETELSVLTVPPKLMNSDVLVTNNGKDVILTIKGKGRNPDTDIPLDLPLTWLLLFNTKTLENYGLIKNISLQDMNEYVDILRIANGGTVPKVPKIDELKNIRNQRVQQINQSPIWEDPSIKTKTFKEFIEYIIQKLKTDAADPAMVELFTSGARYSDHFTFEAYRANKTITIAESIKNVKSFRGYRKGTVEVKDIKDNTLPLKVPINGSNPSNIKYKIYDVDLTSDFSKIQLLITPNALAKIKAKLNASTGDDKLYEMIYDFNKQDPAEQTKTRADMVKIRDILKDTTRGQGLSVATSKAKQQIQQPDLSGYGVLRDPFKDARTTKPKGNVVHKSYNIVNGKFGPDIEIDVPKLYTQLHLTAKKGGAIIYDKPVDKDTLDLLTTRPRRQKAYSQTAVKALAKLIKLSDQPINPNSRKLQMIQKYHNKKRESIPVNADDATLDRLTTLILEHNSGNYPNKNLSNEIAQISDSLFKEGMITKKMHKDIYSRYVMD